MPAYYEKYENLAFTRDARTIQSPGSVLVGVFGGEH
jgi:hypothetical protein